MWLIIIYYFLREFIRFLITKTKMNFEDLKKERQKVAQKIRATLLNHLVVEVEELSLADEEELKFRSGVVQGMLQALKIIEEMGTKEII